jgi:putative ABC transport system permease protein
VNLIKISVAYIARRKLNTLLNVVLLALGMAIIVVLLLFGHQFERNLRQNVQGIDAVVGAKGSPLQLILSSVFHIDVPTGNIPLLEARLLAEYRAVAKAIPLALGDNYRGYRIVGTTPNYIQHYQAGLSSGRLWQGSLEVVLGAQVATETGLGLGDEIVSTHGLTAETASHDHGARPLHIVGILQKTDRVIDQLIVTGVETVWLVHEPHEEGHDHASHGQSESAEEDHSEHDHDHEGHTHTESHDHDHAGHDHDDHESELEMSASSRDKIYDVMGLPVDDAHDADREVTSLLIQYRSPISAISFLRHVNKGTPFLAASPVFETTRLFSLFGVGLDAVRVLGGVLVVTAALSIFVALFHGMKERRYDLAMMRVFGASQTTLVLLVVLEGVMLTFMGTGLGMVLGHVGVEWIGLWTHEARQMQVTGWIFLVEEYWLVALALALGGLSALVPAIQAYRTDVAQILAEAS